jgi:hypothetical protein
LIYPDPTDDTSPLILEKKFYFKFFDVFFEGVGWGRAKTGRNFLRFSNIRPLSARFRTFGRRKFERWIGGSSRKHEAKIKIKRM